jgi:hypothetical protein
MREILTVRAAHGLEYVGGSTTEFTWFEGYAWRIACCGHCHHHLGWRYELAGVAASEEPSQFFGLLAHEVKGA